MDADFAARRTAAALGEAGSAAGVRRLSQWPVPSVCSARSQCCQSLFSLFSLRRVACSTSLAWQTRTEGEGDGALSGREQWHAPHRQPAAGRRASDATPSATCTANAAPLGTHTKRRRRNRAQQPDATRLLMLTLTLARSTRHCGQLPLSALRPSDPLHCLGAAMQQATAQPLAMNALAYGASSGDSNVSDVSDSAAGPDAAACAAGLGASTSASASQERQTLSPACASTHLECTRKQQWKQDRCRIYVALVARRPQLPAAHIAVGSAPALSRWPCLDLQAHLPHQAQVQMPVQAPIRTRPLQPLVRCRCWACAACCF